MTKRKTRWFSRVVSSVLTLCLMFSGFTAGQLMVSAGELAAYRDETVVRFKNVGSGKYLNVHYGQDANEVNVYQWTADNSDEQEFRLRYNPEEDCYLIGAMCSDNGHDRVLDIKKASDQVQAGCNVQIYDATDPVAQQWQFAYQGNKRFTIFPVSKPYTVLTANGNSNGSSGGTSATSAGNVYLSGIPTTTFVSYTNYQLWEIEEVTPLDHPIDDGIYRITSGLEKHLTMDVTDNYNVCHVGNPGNISGLNADEKTQLRTQQLWDVEYINTGYYLITPVADSTRKLAALGDYEMMEANVWAHRVGNPGTWHSRLQWKIVPNVGGGYRIVSKGADSTQALTVAYGDTANFTNVQMSQYHGTPGQRWTFEDPPCPGQSNNYIDGHIMEFVQISNSMYYQCKVCGVRFDTPQEQDFDNPHMPEEVLAVIFALEHMAVLEQMEGENEHFVQACYKATDLLRTQYGGVGFYDFKDRNGNYVSPAQYDYDANTINASVEFELTVYGEQYSADRDILWKVGQLIPFPYNCVYESIWLSLDPLRDFTFADMLAVALANVAEWVPTKPMTDDVERIVSLIGLLNDSRTLYMGEQSIHEEFMKVIIHVYDEDRVDRFIGYYDVNGGQMLVYREEYLVSERTVPLESAPENEIEGLFVADNGWTTEFYADLFS